jgi:stage V sporulation protein G
VEITEVRVFPVHEEKLKAFVSVVLDRCFMVNDIKVIQGREGLFISMPSRKKKNGEFKDIAHPLNNETRRWVEDRVLSEYRTVIAGGTSAVVPTICPERPSPMAGEATLEEVERRHLHDSFWGVGP